MIADQLSDLQWKTLCQEGVIHVPEVFSADELRPLRLAIDEFYNNHPYGNDEFNTPLNEPLEEYILNFIHMPINNPLFASIFEKPILHNTVERMLGKGYFVQAFNMRRVLPGSPRMPYHRDEKGGFSYRVLMDDIGQDEGATTIVKRSHLQGPAPMYCLDNTRAKYPDEVQTIGKAGDVYFHGRECWHARADNNSDLITAIIAPEFVNHSTYITQRHKHGKFINQVMTKEHYEAFDGVLKHALRPFENDKANVPSSWLDKLVLTDHPTEHFFHDLLYSIRAYRGRLKLVDIDALPPHTTAITTEHSISFRQRIEGLSLRLFIRRYVISMTLNRSSIGRFIKRILGRK